ncbi:hypothetical protein ACWCY6_42540 [Streptomyces sp. 900105755]
MIIVVVVLIVSNGSSGPKTATSNPSAQLPTSKAGQIFADPLTSAQHDPNWPVNDYGCEVKDDGLHMSGDDGTCYGPSISVSGNEDVSVKAKWVSGDPSEELGINLSAESINGYIFSILRSGEWQTYGPGAVDRSEPRFSSVINREIGSSNDLTVEVRGSRLIFLVNDQRITSIETGLSQFSVGLFAYNGGEVSFTDLSVNSS